MIAVPTPGPHETEQEFVVRFVNDKSAAKKYEHLEERAAAGYARYRKHTSKKSKSCSNC